MCVSLCAGELIHVKNTVLNQYFSLNGNNHCIYFPLWLFFLEKNKTKQNKWYMNWHVDNVKSSIVLYMCVIV